MYSAGRIAQSRFQTTYSNLRENEKAAVDGAVASEFKTNRYDAATGTLTLPDESKAAFAEQIAYWTNYFADPEKNGGLSRGAVADPVELRKLTAFFVWTAWASATQRPGSAHSYTNNFPYDPLVGNHHTSGALMWSAVSLVFLLGGIAIVLVAFGKFDYLGWHGVPTVAAVRPLNAGPAPITPAQAATVKFMVVASLLFLAQVLIGGGLAHYRAEPGDFFGVDLSAVFPSNLLRVWHLQTMIFWVATSYVGGALFVASALGGGDPKGQRPFVHLLFWAVVLVVVGSLLGQWAGIKNQLGDLWFWLGNQGWEYLEIGRLWQILLAAGLLFWFWLIRRAVEPARANPELRTFVVFFLIAAFAIPFFYLPAFFFGPKTHYSIVDVWRFWIIHLWVEGFFEFFVTVIVSIILYQLGLVRRVTAIRVIYLDAVLYFGGGLMGTAHHWYFTGQTELAMALGATVSALEVVPLILLTLDAWDFYRLTRGESAHGFRHRWTFFFLMAVGFWNFVGAGVFGFLINTPIISYYEIGTILTVNHGHAAFIGVFGMLGVGLMAIRVARGHERFSLAADREVPKGRVLGAQYRTGDDDRLQPFPGGLLQVLDVLQNGYWHARSPEYLSGQLPRLVEWLRMPGDMVFIFVGVLPIVLALLVSYREMWRGQTIEPELKLAS